MRGTILTRKSGLIFCAAILALAAALGVQSLSVSKAWAAENGLQAAQIGTADVNARLSQGKATMSGGDHAIISTNGVGDKVKWTSSNTKVAKVKSTGTYSAEIVAFQPGKTTIKARNNAGTVACVVTVTGTLSKTSLKMSPFNTTKLTFKGLKGHKAVKWTSSNSTVKVDKNGKITPKTDGKAVITCVDNKKCKYRCVVTVTRPKMSCKVTGNFTQSGGYGRHFALVNKSGKTISLNTNVLHYASLDAMKSGKRSIFYTQLVSNPRTLKTKASTKFDGIGGTNAKSTKSSIIGVGFKVGKVQYAAYFTPTTGKILACVRM